MELKQRIAEGILVGVVGGLIATSIGGVGVLAYKEMQASREQLVETTAATKELNDSSITTINRISALQEALDSLNLRLNKIEEGNEVLSNVSKNNSDALSSIYSALANSAPSTMPDFSPIVDEFEITTKESSAELDRLPEINSAIQQIQQQQQQQQIQLEFYKNTQQQQQQQQQQRWQ